MFSRHSEQLGLSAFVVGGFGAGELVFDLARGNSAATGVCGLDEVA